VRMQISLDEHEWMLAREQGKKLGISVAELVRRAVGDVCLWKLTAHGCHTLTCWIPEIRARVSRLMKSFTESGEPFLC